MTLDLHANEESGLEIAIVGMAGRFPGARTPAELWKRLCDGYEAVVTFGDDELRAAGVADAALRDPAYVKAAVPLEDVDRFDAAFFGYTPREASFMDPQQRIFLECAWAALEDAGHVDERRSGKVGVFASCGASTYFLENLRHLVADSRTEDAYQAMLGNDKDFLATRTSYKLDLHGPSLSIQTACSSSLVAVHMASQALLGYQCDLALAGGIKVLANPRQGYLYQTGAILSPDGHCRPFDARAAGTINGSGAGVVVLKRLERALEDGDHVYAVIKGSAVNNDGAQKVGFTAPSVEGQAEAIASALAFAGVSADTIGYVEAHGTGTSLGDPIEIAGLTRAFRMSTSRSGYCAVGSIKSNLGHLDSAAGVAGLIKAALALHHRQLPPSVNFEVPNPVIDFASSPFFVGAALRPWPRNGTPRRAGVSSFGIGGTNAHVVLEEAPEAPGRVAGASEDGPQLLVVSARTSDAAARSAANLARHLSAHPELELADVAHTLQLGRRAFAHRRFAVCSSRDQAVQALEHPTGPPGPAPDRAPVLFMFPGQGSPYVNMARGIHARHTVFREQLEACAEGLRPHLGFDVRKVIFPAAGGEAEAAERLVRTEVMQPALFALEFALARLWMSLGVQPDAMLGHSLGEYVAAALAGVFSLEDALRVVAARGRLIQSAPPGAMLSVQLTRDEVGPWLGKGVSLAAHNGPSMCVLSGPVAAIAEVEAALPGSITCQRLQVSHAFHSSMVEAIREPFQEVLRTVTLRAPAIPYLSNVTGGWIRPEEATSPSYWARQMCQTVRFAESVEAARARNPAIWLEVGPGRTLGGLLKGQGPSAPGGAVLASLRHPREEVDDGVFLLRALGQAWTWGVEPDWTALHGRRPRRVPLPTYPFESRRFWIDRRPPVSGPVSKEEREGEPAPSSDAGESAPVVVMAPRPALATPRVAPRNDLEGLVAGIWQELFGFEAIGVEDSFFELGGQSLLATQIVSRLRERLSVEISLKTFLESPTVAALSARIVEEASQGIAEGDLEAALGAEHGGEELR